MQTITVPGGNLFQIAAQEYAEGIEDLLHYIRRFLLGQWHDCLCHIP